ncbi:MAG: M12 family metallopeptidase [Phycisphaerales bacterium]
MTLATKGAARRWGSTVRFRFHSSVTNSMKEEINAAIADYEYYSQARFQSSSAAAGTITFRRDDEVGGCGNSGVGFSAGGITIRLRESCDKGTVLHEMGHALGLFHEQQRPDREQFVTFHENNVDLTNFPDALGNFTKKTDAECVTHGSYDYGSIMHYPKNAFAKSGTVTLESPQDIGQRAGLSAKDWETVRRLMPSNVHLHQLNGNGSVGPEVTRYDWTEGWSVARYYRIGFADYLFLLKSGNGLMHMHRMNGDGVVGPQIQTKNWSAGWTVAEFFRNGPDTYLFLLKTDTGNMQIRRFNGDGKMGSKVDEANWSSGWTRAAFYSVGFADYALFMKRSGEIHIHKMSGGKVRERVSEHNLPGSGWQIGVHFNQNLGADNRMFFCRNDGKARVQRIEWDGKLGGVIKSYDWTSGWTTGVIYERDWFTKYLFLLKASNGAVHVNKIEGDGKIGPRVDARNWSAGWTCAAVMNNQYLFLIKERGRAGMI